MKIEKEKKIRKARNYKQDIDNEKSKARHR